MMIPWTEYHVKTVTSGMTELWYGLSTLESVALECRGGEFCLVAYITGMNCLVEEVKGGEFKHLTAAAKAMHRQIEKLEVTQ